MDKIILKKKNIFLCLIVFAVISSITLFIIPNMSRGHDLAFHLSRISAIKDNLELGIVGGYIYPNYLGGYGYGNPLFYPDLFLYIPAFLSYIGLSVITSYKIFLFLINFASIFTMFLTIKNITNNKKCALFSSFVYGFSSYRLIDVYTRAALGETLAFVFVPLVILGIYEIIYRNYKKFYILIIGMTGLILSHLISTYIVGILLVVLCLINIKKLWKEKKRIGYLVIAAVITLLLTSYFIFPMLEQMSSGKFSFNNLSETSELLERSLPIWSLFLEFPHHIFTKNWIPCGIGIGFIILTFYYFKNRKKVSSFVHFCFITSVVFLFCSTNLFPWNLFQTVMSPIQFPWRLYLISTLLISIGGGILFHETKLDDKINFLFLICLIPVVSISILNFSEQNIKKVGEYDVYFGEYIPTSTDRETIEERGNIILSDYPIDYTLKREGTTLEVAFQENKTDNHLELPILYYKGYQAVIGEKKLETYQTENGLVGVMVPSIESGNIVVEYAGTMIQKFSKIISIISSVMFIAWLVIKKRGVV